MNIAKRVFSHSYIILIGLSLLIPSPAFAQDIRYVTATLFSGGFNSIIKDGDYIYCGTEHAFQKFSISDPENPQFVAGSPTRYIYDIFVEGDYAYFGQASFPLVTYFQSFDISQSNSIVVLDSVFTSGIAFPIEVKGNYAFTIDAYYGFYIIDISDPFNLNVVADFETGGDPQYISVSGNYAYVATWSDGLHIVDISDFQNMNIVGNYPSTIPITSVFVQGSYAYITQRVGNIFTGRLAIINIDDPTIPVFTGSYQAIGFFSLVKVDGNYAYVTKQVEFGYDFLIIDIFNPSFPSLTGNYSSSTHGFSDFQIQLPYCYTADGISGVSTFDVSNPQNPELVGRYLAPHELRALAVNDSAAYVITKTELWTINIANPAEPVITASVDSLDFNVRGIHLNGDYLYVCGYVDGLKIFDLSDLWQPELIGTYDQYAAYSVYVEGNYAFISSFVDGMVIIDISNPISPIFVSELTLPGYTDDIRVHGNYAYIANRQNGLYVINISDIINPVIAGQYDTPDDAVGIYVEGNYAYIADGDSGLQIINVQDPTNPTLVSNVVTEEFANNVVIVNDYAVVADDSAGIQIIDISDINNPVIVSSFDTPGLSLDCKTNDDYIYVADKYSVITLRYDELTHIIDDHEITPSTFEISAYPNPFNSSCKITVSDSEIEQVSIYNITGRLVETVDLVNGQAVWDASGYSAGVYLAKATSNNQSQTIKLVYLK